MEKLPNYFYLTHYILLLSTFWTTQAVIPYPPTIIKQPPPDYIPFQVANGTDEKERPFLLECEAKGEPKVDYKWKKNGQQFQVYAKFQWQVDDNRISQQPGRGTLVFLQPRDVDEGYYQCFASNEHGTAVSNVVFVRKSELNSFPDERVEERVVNEGDPLTLQCNPPTGFPKPTIFWITESDNGALSSINSPRITVDPEGRLHFSNVTVTDSSHDSVYACSASIVYRNEYKLGNKVKLDVISAGFSGVQARNPLMEQYVSPPNIVAMRGDTLELYCIFSGTPLPEIRWKKKVKALPMGRTQYLNYGKTLKIRKVDFDDEGTYECTASNGLGTVESRTMVVTVQAKPYWISKPSDQNAAEDEDIEFECKASGVPEPEVKWFVNGVPLNDAKPNPRRKILSPTSIRIEKLEKTDTAVYQCNISNTHGYVFTNFYVNVLAIPPNIVISPEPLYEVIDGCTIKLSCEVFGSPKPVVKWTRNKQELTGNRFTILDNGDLEIRNALFTDAGKYQCIAKNKFGEAKSSEDVGVLEVKEQTRITLKPEDQEVAAGQSATFRCEAAADHTLIYTIEWMMEDKIIDFDQNPRMFKAMDNSLHIAKTSELDSGKYTCLAQTRLDNVTAEAMLIVQDVPNQPRMVGVECNSLTARVHWQPMGDNRARILSYNIQYNTSFTPDSWEDAFSSVPASDFKFEVAMSPWANYSFRVIARNKIGESLPSFHSEQCQTPPDVPYKNPENVVGKGTTPTNLVISWTPMPPIEHNAPGFFYRVYYRLDRPYTIWMPPIDISDWTKSQYEVTNQETFKRYIIKVEAHNSIGQADVVAMEVIGYSGEYEQTRIIVKPEDYEVAAGQSATFRCEAAADPKLIYTIEWMKEDEIIDFDQNPRMFKAMDNSLHISKTSELDSGKYTCLVQTRLDSVTAEAMLIVQDIPNPPSMVGVECSSQTAGVHWQPMGDNRAPILGYKIQYNTSFTPYSWEDAFSSVPASDFKFKVAMSPWVNYSFRVIAINKIGESLPSVHSEQCQTPPDVPYKNPENVVGKGTTPTNLVISWTPMPPIDHNAPGFFYRVYYRLDRPDTTWMPPVDISDWTKSQYEVTNQETFKRYIIKVEAHNSIGQANVAAMEVIGYSGEDVPLLAPANLTLLRIISGKSAEIAWNSVPQTSVNGHFKGYKIQTWLPVENANQGREMIVASNITRTTVEMLVPFAENRIQVLVFNGRYNGPPSGVISFFTPEAVPGPVQSFEAVAMGANALYLMWKKPLEENGKLTGYKLNWEKVEGTELSKIQEPKVIENPGETRTKLGNLESGTKYRVTIRALTSVGEGIPSYIDGSTYTTMATAPDKPTFTWELLSSKDNKAGVKVTWLPNVDGHPGSQFFVQYKRKDDAQFTQTDHETNGDSIEIKDLDPGTVYEMGVVAVDGPYMIPSDITEIETVGAVIPV